MNRHFKAWSAALAIAASAIQGVSASELWPTPAMRHDQSGSVYCLSEQDPASEKDSLAPNTPADEWESLFGAPTSSVYQEASGRWVGIAGTFSASTLPTPPEHSDGYALRINTNGVALTAETEHGFRNGMRTLRQLVFRKDGKMFLPATEISDYPALPVRGMHFMLNQIPFSNQNFELSLRYIRMLSDFKYNALLLQLDGLPDYQSCPDESNGSRWPLVKIGALADYAKSLGMEVIPTLQLGGHASWLLARPNMIRFREIASAEADKPLNWGDALCPGQNAELLPILFAMIDELVATIKPQRFHLGYDEISTGEKQCPACLANATPMAELYGRQINALADHLKNLGVNAIIWSDQMLPAESRYALYGTRQTIDGAQLAATVNPKLVTPMNWYYGEDFAAFQLMDQYFASRGFHNQIAAVMCFDGNNRAGALAAEKLNWKEVFNTLWFHLKGIQPDQSSPRAWNSIPWFAEMSWNAGRETLSEQNSRNRLDSVRNAWNRQFDDSVNFVTIALESGDIRNAKSFSVPPRTSVILWNLRCEKPADIPAADTYDGCTLFPIVGKIIWKYADKTTRETSLRYRFNIGAENDREEMFGVHTVFPDDRPIHWSILENPDPTKELTAVVIEPSEGGIIRSGDMMIKKF